MTIDEAISKYKEITNTDANCPAHCNISCDKCLQESKQIAEWLEELKAIKSDGFTDNLLDMGFTKGYNKALEELKVIKEMDLSIPQHFTKEQSDWIKKYCINRNKEFYNKALDDFVKFANTMPTVETEDGTIRPMWLEEMAERLKEQNK